MTRQKRRGEPGPKRHMSDVKGRENVRVGEIDLNLPSSGIPPMCLRTGVKKRRPGRICVASYDQLDVSRSDVVL